MSKKVTPIFGNTTAAVAERERFLPEIAHVIDAARQSEDLNVLLENHFLEAGLDRDAASIWIGYPSLQHAAISLLSWVGHRWPSALDTNRSAAFEAIDRALHSVRQGLDRKEVDRRFVIANFHDGLAAIAADLSAFEAWGCLASRAVQQWVPFSKPFEQWVEEGQFDRVIFSKRDDVCQSDNYGMIWKMRSNVAPVRDVGLTHRYGER